MSRPPITVRLAPDVPDLAALGASSPEDLLAEPPRVVTAARLERVGKLWRVPLPGTPDRDGQQHEKPRGAGTGQLYLQRYGGGWPALRARLSHPRSTSLAARDWNIACHLQANGVTTPQLVALLEQPGPLSAPLSVLITRELEGFVSLRTWLRSPLDSAARERGLESLERALEAVQRCGVALPGATLDNVMLQARASDDCVALQLTNLGSEQAILRERGLVRSRLPTIAFTQLRGASLVSGSEPRRGARWVTQLQRELALLAPTDGARAG
ncbi:MAG: hypothetical protein JNN27_03180 [Planctomycetes bacterium]|nr:hypothetical protein [Planctomycetota bacterium]